MRKFNFTLIGVSIVLQLTGFIFPVIGIGTKGLDITIIPLSLVASLLLLMFGLRGLYQDTRNQNFYSGIILSIVGMGLIIAGTIFSPIITGGRFFRTIEWILMISKGEFADEELFSFFIVDLCKSVRTLYIVMTLGSLFYSISLIKFISGLLLQNVDHLHLYNMRRTIKIFAVSSFILILIATIIIIMFTDVMKIASLPYDNIMEEDLLRAYIYRLIFFIILVPAAIVFLIFYFINIIKSIKLVFKTPKKFIKSNSES